MACKPGFFMNPSQLCAKECPPRYYPSLQTSTCQLCPYDCLTCDSSGNCISCDTLDHRMLFSNISRCQATPNFYDNKSQICLPCPKTCLLCQSETYCISCRPGYYLNFMFQCAVDCPPYYYRDKTTLTCFPCPYDCQNCDVNGQCSGCNALIDNRVLSN